MGVELNELSAAERLVLVQDLWDSVVADAETLPLTAEERHWVGERVAYADRLDAEWSDWSQVVQLIPQRPAR